jgi:DNA-binding XRE family transcriptional regulator
MTKICKKAAQFFHCTVSKVFDRVKSVALWSANIRKLAKDHKVYGSAARDKEDFSSNKFPFFSSPEN